MASLLDLQEKLKSLFNKGVQSISQPRTAQHIGSTTPNTLGQKVFNAVGSFNPADAIPFTTPQVRQAIKPFVPTVGQYAQGQIIKPIQQGMKVAGNPNESLTNRVLGGVQAGFGGFSATPIGTGFNAAYGATAGALRSIRTGQDIRQSIRQGISQPSDIGGTGLGIENPFLAAGVDVATGNPKGLLKNVKTLGATVKGLKGYSPRAFDIHPADQEIMGDFINTVQTGGGKKMLDPRLRQDVDRIAEHYIGKSTRNITNEKLAKVFDALLSNAAKTRGEDVLQTSFPKMGFTATPKIEHELSDALAGASNPQEEAQIVKEFTDHAISIAKGDSLKATRAALNKELAGLAGEQGNYKGNYAAQQILRDDPMIGSRINALQESIARIDEAIKKPLSSEGGIVKGKIKISTTPTQTELQNRAELAVGKPDLYTQRKVKLDKAFGPTPDQPIIKLNTRKAPPVENVVEDIKSGFNQGRKARDKELKGGLKLKLRSEVVDRLSPIYDFVKQGGIDKLPAEKNPYKQMRLLAGVSGKVNQFLDSNVAPILKRELPRQDDLSALLVLDRERELLSQGLARKRDINQIAQGVDELRAKYGEEGFRTLQQSATQIRQVYKGLKQELVDSGIISKEASDAMDRKGEFYVGFEAVAHMADELDLGRGTGSYNVASQDVVKRIGDYIGDVADPLESLIRKVPKVIGLVEKNKAIQSLVNLRNEYPDLYKGLIVPMKSGTEPGKGIINVFENGKNVRYAVPDVVEAAIKNLDAQSANIVVKLLSPQAKILRAGATGLNIGFIPVNIVRDVQDAITTELSEKGAKAALQLIGSYPRAILSAIKKDDLYQEWLKAGGSQSTMTEQIFDKTTKSLGELSGKKPKLLTQLNPVLGAKGLIEFANRVGEQSTRIARFKSGLSRNESAAEAAFKSRDISLDFAKAGNSIKTLNQVIPFLNAGIQGTEKLLRMYRQNPVQATLATSLVFTPPTIALYQHNSQFNDWNDIPLTEKQNYWIIIARDRTPEEIANNEKIIGIKIAKGFLGRMTANTIESVLDFAKQKDPQGFGQALLNITAGLSPVGLPYNKEQLGQSLSTVLPPGIKAGIEGVSNTNLHFGQSIVPQSLQNLPPSEQYRESTPAIYRLGNKVTGISPLILENTVNTTTGGLGRQAANIMGGDVEKASVDQVARRFVGIQGGVQTDKAYDTVEKEKQWTALRNKQVKDAYLKGNQTEFDRLTAGMDRKQIKQLINSVEDKEASKKLTPEQRAYDSLSKEERERLGAERPELKSKLELLDQAEASVNTGIKIKGEESKIEWDDENGRTQSVNLTAKDYSDKTGIAAFQEDNSNAGKARKLWAAPTDQVSNEEKIAAYEKLGFTPDEVRYDYKANFDNAAKTKYINSQNLEHDKLVEELEKGRVESISGQRFASDGVIEELKDQELITKEEASTLKKLKLDQDGNPITKQGSGTGKKGKITISRTKPAKINFTKFTKRKAPTLKLSKSRVVTKPKVSKIKLTTPSAKISYKVVKPSRVKGLTNAVHLA